jgi:hypothetical protein
MNILGHGEGALAACGDLGMALWWYICVHKTQFMKYMQMIISHDWFINISSRHPFRMHVEELFQTRTQGGLSQSVLSFPQGLTPSASSYQPIQPYSPPSLNESGPHSQ